MGSSQGVDAGKTALREEYTLLFSRARRPKRGGTSPDVRILKNLTTQSIWENAPLVLTYVSRGGEVDTHALMRSAWAQHKRVAVPRRNLKAGALEFFVIDSEKDLVEGPDGYLEPARKFDEPLKAPDMVGSLCVVPGLVFDAIGNRIGAGTGTYDRFLAFYPGHKVALVRAIQVSSNELPHQDHDIPVDYLVTESCVWECRPCYCR